VASSQIVIMYRLPLKDFSGIGPARSEWTRSRGTVAFLVLDGKGVRCCFPWMQGTHVPAEKSSRSRLEMMGVMPAMVSRSMDLIDG
jgi:hypothetical protein